ncbi:MAG: efflux RND transporter periplasmic adaptor subunit [Betaproteobacteria bacterium]|nr:efflux RND transporter periplasmic adaptor subunit [Betaproteobacteria bacterium]
MKTALSVLAIALLLAGCGDRDKPAAAPAPRVMQAQTAVIQPTQTTAYLAMPAAVVAEQQFQAASRLMGYLREIAVVEGQTVGAGQRLFSIDPVEVQGQADQARAGLQQALDAQRDARLEYDRYAALFKEEAVTRQQFEKMKLHYDLATSRVAQAQAGVSTAGNQLRYATVTSPIAGVVTKKLANAGDLAVPGQPVLVVENPARLQVETHVPEEVLKALKPGAAVRVEVDGQAQPLQAAVARISPAADPVTRLFLVKLNVQGSGLKSGLFARALFPQGERQTLSVPAAALITRAGITGVFVVGADGLAQFRMVRAGESRDGQVEIQAGLSAGEKVVVGGAERLESGDKVSG